MQVPIARQATGRIAPGPRRVDLRLVDSIAKSQMQAVCFPPRGVPMVVQQSNLRYILSSAIVLFLLSVALVPSATLPPVGASHDTGHCFDVDPLDVGLVIDRSGSMGTDRMQDAKDGADLLVQELTSQDQSGLVSYSSSATHDKHIDFDHAATRSAISALSSGGTTATGDAIALSHSDFNDHARWSTARPVMVLLTDGHTNAGIDPVVAAQAAKDDGIEIFAMGVGSGVNEVELKQIASDPVDGHYFNPADGQEVLDAFLEIANMLARNDLEDPTIESIDVPAPGHLYVNGVDYGPGSGLDPNRATVVGPLAFEASFHDDCWLENVEFSTTPDVGWSHAENKTDIITIPFPCHEVPPGDYDLEIEVTDWVDKRALGGVPFECAVLDGQSVSIAAWTGTTVPASAEYQSTGIDLREEGEVVQNQVDLDLPTAQVYAQAVEETASSVRGETTVNHEATNQLASVELLDGLVQIEGLNARAQVDYDLIDVAGVHNVDSQIEKLIIDGDEIPLDPGPQDIDLPGGLGFLRLHETEVVDSAGGIQLRHNLVHAYLDLPYGRAEVILGGIVLQAGLSPTPLAQERTIHGHDDADTGGDAGDTPGEAEPITPGLYDGSLPPGDTVDYYEIGLEHGDKINLLLLPAPRATVTGGELHLEEADPLNPDVVPPDLYVSGLESYELRLFDPTGDERESSTLAVAGAPQRIELNADLDGVWQFEVKRITSPTEGYNYTLGVGVSPVPLLPDEPLFNGAQACIAGDPGIDEISTGLHPKTMQHDDFVDVYKFTADIGDLVSVTMKPGETLDGWSAALTLYDENCDVLDRQDADLLDLKGVPKVTPQLPALYTGEYYVEVERLNGVGNYYLGLTVNDPFPGLPVWGDDDPPENHQSADEAPPVFFQGELPDNDPGDAYLLPFEEGKEAFVAVKMSAASTVDVKLYQPDGTTLVPQDQNVLGGQLVVYQFEAPATGDYGLEIRPTLGGGTYGVSWGQAPVEIPEV